MSKKHSDKQIGGEHYKHMKIQVTEFVAANDIPFIEGNVIKYVCRHAHKNGKEDVLKAIHYLNLLIEHKYESNDIRESLQEERTSHNTDIRGPETYPDGEEICNYD
jgi:molybdopterin-guanine dinucleotide biosynthesis protein A